MLSRTDHATKPEIQNHASYQFYIQIQDILPKAEAALHKKIPIVKDGHESARDNFIKLKSFMAVLEPIMMNEESSRIQFALPLSISKGYSSAEKALDKASNTLKQFMIDTDKKRSELTLRDGQLSEDIQVKQLEMTGEQGEIIVANNDEFNKLSARREELFRHLDDVNRKIDKKCCSCIPKTVEKEREDLRKTEEEVKQVSTKIENIQSKPTKKQEHEAAIKKMKDEQVSVRNALDQLDREYPGKLKRYKENLLETEVLLKEKEVEIKKCVRAMTHLYRLS